MPSPTWSPAARVFILVLALALLVWLGLAIAPLVEVVGIAVLLALLLNPLVHLVMRRTGLRRPLAAALVFALFVLVLVGIPLAMGTLAVTQLANLTTDLVAAVDQIRQSLLQPIDILGYHLELETLLGDAGRVLSETLALLPRGSLTFLSGATAGLLWGLTVFVTLYYLLKDGPRIKPWAIKLAPPAYQPEMARLADEIDEIWGKFLRIQLLIFIILAALMLLGTLLVVWLFRSGMLRWSFLGFVVLLLLVYTAVQQIDNLWLRPQFMGRHLQLHPGIVFVGLIAGLVFGGLLGAIIVVPAIATARVVGRYVHRKLLGQPPWDDVVPDGAAAENRIAESAAPDGAPGNEPSLAEEQL